jgi:hypothetical protein
MTIRELIREVIREVIMEVTSHQRAATRQA